MSKEQPRTFDQINLEYNRLCANIGEWTTQKVAAEQRIAEAVQQIRLLHEESVNVQKLEQAAKEEAVKEEPAPVAEVASITESISIPAPVVEVSA